MTAAEVSALPTDPALTGPQRDALNIILAHVAQWGFPPTVREIGEAMGGLSSSTVHAYLVQLENCGAIKRRANGSRAITVVQAA